MNALGLWGITTALAVCCVGMLFAEQQAVSPPPDDAVRNTYENAIATITCSLCNGRALAAAHIVHAENLRREVLWLASRGYGAAQIIAEMQRRYPEDIVAMSFQPSAARLTEAILVFTTAIVSLAIYLRGRGPRTNC